ncbi:YisL family protein [Shouchella lonarensis]|nr:YisL family protein [Shouchella lonarensis]
MKRLAEIFSASHEGAWFIFAVLFFAAYLFALFRKYKVSKVFHMILRLFYVIMLVSGIGMIIHLGFPYFFVIKGILAVTMIGFMEVAIGKQQRGERTIIPLFVATILVIVVMFMGTGQIRF